MCRGRRIGILQQAPRSRGAGPPLGWPPVMLSRRLPAAVLAVAVLPAGTASALSIPLQSAPISIAMSPASPRAGSEVRLTGGAGASNYAWDLDGDGQFDDATGTEVSASFAAGTRTVRAQAVT